MMLEIVHPISVILLVLCTILRAEAAVNVNKSEKISQNPILKYTGGQDNGQYNPQMYGQESQNQPGDAPNNDNKDQQVEKSGYTKGRVFEYSFATHHSDPKVGSASIDKDTSMAASGSGLSSFQDHMMVRDQLPRFFTYSDGESFGDAPNESKSVYGAAQSLAPRVTLPSRYQARQPEHFEPQDSPTDRMVPEASYALKYRPPSMPQLPSFMRMSFADEADESIDDDKDDEFMDIQRKPKPRDHKAQSKEKSAATLPVISIPKPSAITPVATKSPRVRMHQEMMGAANEHGKPWGTKTTMLYRDPSQPDNYMQVTEVKVEMNSKNPKNQNQADQVSQVVTSKRSNYKRGGGTQSRPASKFYQEEDFNDEGQEPEEPIF
ncbi:uncharacterized protein LOC141849974 [Brevipalpus obovatus]|uniref:uncharacterized protein LOC141849974 n=1 Tax=Brevipalpus obovatus TaxID=246614 RepID=UPI003D9E6971